jgi:glycosyltransferase involved in cell wall biosynthesis
VENDIDFAAHNVKVHTIPCGVDMQKFDPGDLSKKAPGTNIAWVCEKWPTKGIDYMLQILAALPEEYQIHALGPWNDRYAWEEAYQKDFLNKHCKDRFIEYDWVENIVDWYKDKSYVLSCSKKEGFGYSIAEGMAMGLRPVVHSFYGAELIWGRDMRWDTIDQAVKRITKPISPQAPQACRDMLVMMGYTLDEMIKRIESEVLSG